MDAFFNKWRKEIITGFVILLVALTVRILDLTTLPVFADEAIYVRWAQVMKSVPSLRFIPLSDGKQPFYMWSVIPFLKVFEDPLFAGRVVSVLTGMGTLLGLFVLMLIVFRSIRLGFVAAFLLAVSPFTVFFDRLALSDSMLSFFGVWSTVFLILTVRTLRLDTAMLAGFCLGGALITKSPAIYFVLLSPLGVFLSDRQKGRLSHLNLFKKIMLLTVILFIAFCIYNILRLGPEFHMIALRNKDYVYPLSHIFTSPFDPLKPFLDRILEYFWILGPFTLFGLFIIGLLKGMKNYPKETLYILILALIPITISAEFSKTMTARYVYFSVPYVFAISALAFLDFETYKEKRVKSFSFKFSKSSKVSIILLIAFIIQSIYTDFLLLREPEKAYLPRTERSGYLEEWTAGYGIKEVSTYLKNEAKNSPTGERIVVGTEGYFGTLPDGLQIYLNEVKNITVIGVGQPIREVHQSLRESKLSGNKTYLVVNDTRFLGDKDKLGLKLLSEYPKALKPDGTRESLLFLELTD